MIYTKYDANSIEIRNIEKIEEFTNDKDDKVKWLQIVGLDDINSIKDLCNKLGVHSLVSDDILGNNQRPKIDDYESYIYLKSQNITFINMELKIQKVSFILFADRIISFEETKTDLFIKLGSRLKDGTLLRKNGADDLLYGLLESIVENYFNLMEVFGDKIDDLEDELLQAPSKEILEKIYYIKRELIFIRNTMWPMREVASNLSKNEYDLINGRTIYYFRDIADDIIQIIDIVENYREICSGMLDTYLSSIGNKTNDVMKVLTIFTTIFTPLTFLAGIYGMNFKYFPELEWRYSYLAFWLVSIAIILLMFRYFKKKDWL